MKFDQGYNFLLDRQTESNQLIVLLAEDTLREIYECISRPGDPATTRH